MTLSNKLNKLIKSFDWIDVSLVKLSVLVFALLLAKYFPILTNLDWYVYVLIFIVTAVRPVSKMVE